MTLRHSLVAPLMVACAIAVLSAPAGAQARHTSRAAAAVIQSYQGESGGCRARAGTRLSALKAEGGGTLTLTVEYPRATTDPSARDVWCEAEKVDWSAGRAIAFRVKASPDVRLSVSFLDRNGVAYTAWVEVPADTWREVEIPFETWRPNPYFQPPDARSGKPLDVSEVRRIGFSPQAPGAGMLVVGPIVLAR